MTVQELVKKLQDMVASGEIKPDAMVMKWVGTDLVPVTSAEPVTDGGSGSLALWSDED